MEANEKVIQSYMPHGMTFEDKDKLKVGEHVIVLVVPAAHNVGKSDDRIPCKIIDNVVITTDEVIAQLTDDPTFKAMLDAKLIKIMGTLPAKYQDQTSTLIKTREALDVAQSARDAALSDKDVALAENEALKKRIAELEGGSEIKSIDPAKLAAARAAAQNAAK